MTQKPNELAFAYDLTLDEARRRTAVLEAIGDDWDPIQALAEEELAWDMLYSGLDERTAADYDELVAPACSRIGRRTVLPIDPHADRGRRAWLPCPRCDHGARCTECQSSRNCATHWQFLLSNQAWLVHLQCPGCGHVWQPIPGRAAVGATTRRPESRAPSAGHSSVHFVELLGLLIGQRRPRFHVVKNRRWRIDQGVGRQLGVDLVQLVNHVDSTGTYLVYPISLA